MWIDVQSRIPRKGVRVKIKHFDKWESTGFVTDTVIDSINVWSIKLTKGLDFSNSIPTHWFEEK